MADVMRLTNIAGGIVVDFSPLFGFTQPDERDRSVRQGHDGRLFIYEASEAWSFDIGVNNISPTDYTKIITWWESMDSLKLYYNYVDPYKASFCYVRIINEERPLQMMQGEWQGKYEGTLMLREIGAGE